MQHAQCGGRARRRWRRERVAFTVLGRFAGGDRLGRAVNLSERGLGAVFHGRGYAVDQAVEVQLVADGAVRRAFGVICSVVARGRHTRLGIRTYGFIPADESDAQRWAASRRKTNRRSRAVYEPPDPAMWNFGAGFAPVSPGSLQAIERDRRELSGELRSHYATRGDEPWDEVVRRFLHHLPGSPLRSRFLREQFRAAMSTRYPVAAGTEIRGRVLSNRTGMEGQKVPPCLIHLDHFAVACADRSGNFVARGIPPLDDPVSVPLRIANHAVLSVSPVAVHLPRLATVRIEVVLPIVLRAAAEHVGNRPPAQDEPAGWDLDLDSLRGMVDQL